MNQTMNILCIVAHLLSLLLQFSMFVFMEVISFVLSGYCASVVLKIAGNSSVQNVNLAEEGCSYAAKHTHGLLQKVRFVPGLFAF